MRTVVLLAFLLKLPRHAGARITVAGAKDLRETGSKILNGLSQVLNLGFGVVLRRIKVVDPSRRIVESAQETDSTIAITTAACILSIFAATVVVIVVAVACRRLLIRC